MVSKNEALNKKGKLKKGYYYDLDGQIRRSQKVVRTKSHRAAKELGSLGGKANAKRFK